MSALWLTIRAILRRAWPGVLALSLLVGLAGGAVLTAWAGARRTQSAYARLERSVRAADVLVSANVDVTRSPKFVDFGGVGHLPQVAQAGTILGFGVGPRLANGQPPEGDFGSFGPAPVEAGTATTFDAPLVLEGRMPAPGAIDEIAVNDEQIADFARAGQEVRVGSTAQLLWFNFFALNRTVQQVEAERREPTPAEVSSVFHPFDARVVGRVRLPTDIVANENQDNQTIFLSPAFASAHRADASFMMESIRLRDSRQLTAFEDAARSVYPVAALRFTTPAERLNTFAAAVGPYVDTLHLFALIVALTAFLVLAQAFVRQARTAAADAETLRALGFRRRRIAVAVATPGFAAAAAGSAIAVVAGVVASHWFPVGVARRAEPSPGVRIDAWVLAAGGIAIAVAFAIAVAVTAARIASQVGVEPRERSGRRTVELSGPTVASTIGLRHAFDRRSRATVGTTFAALVIAIATGTAALGFGSALGALVSTPQRWGWNWDKLFDTFETGLSPDTATMLTARQQISAVTIGTRGTITIQGRAMPAFGFEVRRGHAEPNLISGGLPAATNDIAFGARTLRELHLAVGDAVDAQDAKGRTFRLHVVGSVVLTPSLDLNANHRIGEGATMTARGLHRIDPGAKPSFALVNLRDGRPSTQKAAGAGLNETGGFFSPQRPSEITSYGRVRRIPVVLATLLGLLAIGVVAHALLSSLRARRREYAVLKALGLARRQIAAAVTWETTAIVGAAALVGVTLGLAASHAVWTRFVHELGVQSPAVAPVASVLALISALLVLTNAFAIWPAWRAARSRPAPALRSE